MSRSQLVEFILRHFAVSHVASAIFAATNLDQYLLNLAAQAETARFELSFVHKILMTGHYYFHDDLI